MATHPSSRKARVFRGDTANPFAIRFLTGVRTGPIRELTNCSARSAPPEYVYDGEPGPGCGGCTIRSFGACRKFQGGCADDPQ